MEATRQIIKVSSSSKQSNTDNKFLQGLLVLAALGACSLTAASKEDSEDSENKPLEFLKCFKNKTGVTRKNPITGLNEGWTTKVEQDIVDVIGPPTVAYYELTLDHIQENKNGTIVLREDTILFRKVEDAIYIKTIDPNTGDWRNHPNDETGIAGETKIANTSQFIEWYYYLQDKKISQEALELLYKTIRNH